MTQHFKSRGTLRMDLPNIFCNLVIWSRMHQVVKWWLRPIELSNSCGSHSELRQTYIPKSCTENERTTTSSENISQSRNLLTHPIGNAAANAIQKVTSKVGKRSSSAHLKTSYSHDFLEISPLCIDYSDHFNMFKFEWNANWSPPRISRCIR